LFEETIIRTEVLFEEIIIKQVVLKQEYSPIRRVFLFQEIMRVVLFDIIIKSFIVG
jgi:hypothetical protein